MKKKVFTGHPGQSAEILTQKLLRNPLSKEKSERKILKNSFQQGTYQDRDLSDIYIGYSVLEEIIKQGLDITESNIKTGEKDVSKAKLNLVSYHKFINTFCRRIDRYLKGENALRKHLIKLREHYQYAQAARDGILLKQCTRIEKDPQTNQMREVTYDTSMTPREVLSILDDYETMLEILTMNKIGNYMGLGTSFIGMIGMFSKMKEKEKGKGDPSKKSFPIIPLGGLVASGFSLLQRFTSEKDSEEARKLSRMDRQLTYDLLHNEQISDKAEDAIIEEIRSYSRRQKDLENKTDNKRFAFDAGASLVLALIIGIYIKNHVSIKDNNKLDGKELANALIGISETGVYISNATKIINRFLNDREEKANFLEISEKVKEIEKQMQEKVYPLKGATQPFDGFCIRNLDGKFYPTTDYDSGEIKYGSRIFVKEFSMKRGDVVLLSGESGTGKSTFLRFLKRGDINNQAKIELDNGERVDHFGREYISFRPSINLGNETSALNQITGKNSIYELSKEEKEHLLKIMTELKLSKDGILEELAQKKFMQFSTGQQRRLALSKVFYRINDGTSVVIVDEPVGNVEDSLIREQLEIIKQYAKNKNVMLILVTHRIDLAKDLVNKRYHISSDGKMEEVPVTQREERND